MNKFSLKARSRFAIFPRAVRVVPVNNDFSIAAYWSDGMDEDGLADWARRLRARETQNAALRRRIADLSSGP